MKSTQANYDLLQRRERRLTARLERYRDRYNRRDRTGRTGRPTYLFNLIERLADKRNEVSRQMAVMARYLYRR